MNNMLIGVYSKINFIFITRDQNSQPKFATPYEQYVEWGDDINFIFIATWSQMRRSVRVAAMCSNYVLNPAESLHG